jgi:rhamnosyltransferase
MCNDDNKLCESESESEPNVVILLAAYNGLEFLPEQLNTLLCQQGISVTIYVSVDRSTDGTEKWLLDIQRKDFRIHILENGFSFGGAARNFYRLIKEVDFTSFDYVAFADQDDLWAQDKLVHAIKQLECIKADAYSSNVTAFWQDGTEKLIHKAQSQVELDYLFEAAGPGCTYILRKGAAMFVKQYLTQYPELNSFYLHDWLIYAILRHHNYVWYIDPIPKMKYRQHASNQVGANTSLRGLYKRFKTVFAGDVIDSIRLLLSTLNIQNIKLDSRYDVFKLAFMTSKLRRRKVDRLKASLFFLFYSLFGKFK